jgi:hypothetical protein
MAMVSIDQVLHGTRSPPGTNYDLAFFNITNPIAAVSNVKQGALDNFQVLRLVKSINVAQAPTTAVPIKFDPTRILFKGHSQGGLTGPLFLAVDPEVRTAVLSGAGAILIESLLNKTIPDDIPAIVDAILSDGTVDEFHPMLNMVQMVFETSEPANYARLLFREPPTGFAPKNVFQSLGIVDHVAPVPDIKALALSLGVQPVSPMIDPIDGLDLVGLAWGTPPVQLNAANGSATAVLLEYSQVGTHDGHFVIFTNQAAVNQSNRFLATAAATGVARLDPP